MQIHFRKRVAANSAVCDPVFALVLKEKVKEMEQFPDSELRAYKPDKIPIKHQAFLSHTAPDTGFIKSNIIIERRFNIVLFNYREPGGLVSAAYKKEILRLLSDSAWFFVAVSPRAVESMWVKFEVSWACENRPPDRIISLVIEPCDPGKLNPQLSSCRQIDFSVNASSARTELTHAAPEVFYT